MVGGDYSSSNYPLSSKFPLRNTRPQAPCTDKLSPKSAWSECAQYMEMWRSWFLYWPRISQNKAMLHPGCSQTISIAGILVEIHSCRTRDYTDRWLWLKDSPLVGLKFVIMALYSLTCIILSPFFPLSFHRCQIFNAIWSCSLPIIASL